MKTVLLVVTALLVFTGCFGSNKPQEWTSFIYPDKSNNKRSMASGKFASLEECRQASLAKLKALNLETRGDYKCALDCEYHEGMKTEICKEMTK